MQSAIAASSCRFTVESVGTPEATNGDVTTSPLSSLKDIDTLAAANAVAIPKRFCEEGLRVSLSNQSPRQ